MMPYVTLKTGVPVLIWLLLCQDFVSVLGSISDDENSFILDNYSSNNGINSIFGGSLGGNSLNSELSSSSSSGNSRPPEHSSRSSTNSFGSDGHHRHRHHHGNNALAPVGGPNVCRSRIRTYCCPGWSQQKTGSGLCVIPICSRACGAGRCVKPNLCLCDGGTISTQCQGSRDGGGSGRPGGISPPGLSLPGSISGSSPGGSGTSGSGQGSNQNGCQISCLNGGTCLNNKCTCRNGYSGEFCGEPVCRESCLNGGRCIGPDRCACIYGYTGRKCEADYRTGPCFTKITGNICGSQLLGVVCTRQLCCATVGKAWGHPCEPCPDYLDCEPGHLKNIHSSQCIDIDECEAIPGICEGGKCINTPGSFRCECPPGQVALDGGGRCEDENECLRDDVCKNGRCINTDQEYYCICDRGFIPSQDRKFCIDARQGNCFTSVLRGICRGKLTMKLTKRDCCCGMNMGKGWGDENNCDMCPSTDSGSYKELCVEPGLLMQVDECGLRPDICGNGRCYDIPDGYRCECHPGYIQRSPMSPCEDIDECNINRHQTALCQGGRCVNTLGSYNCVCPQGFDVSSDGKFCIDHDECSESGMCANGVCINMDGSFKCSCREGYILSPTGHSCIDQDECLENPRICLSGRCENTPGSYKCSCLDGFTPTIDQAFCVDKNECAETGMCGNGRCLNLDGGFKCVCNPGYKLGPTGKHCVDLNECDQNVCLGGHCKNTQGSFKCECFPGLILGPDGRTCLDTQRDTCFKSYRDGLCLEPSILPVPKSTCCCFGVGSPMGWGSLPCRPCPLPGTADFDMLCPHGVGKTHTGDDINECALNPSICTNGACSNTEGSWTCHCDHGYQVDPTGRLCLDINECEIDDLTCGGGQCKNTPGSFQCICPIGTQYDARTQVCQDIDECVDLSQEVCKNGRCQNTLGSFSCDCNDGYILDPTERFCIDNRRGNCWTKAVAGKCEGNLRLPMLREECCCSVGKAWGSPCEVCDPRLCECQPGFAKVDGKTCTDIDECTMNPGICQGGGTCLNTEGSFTCSCPPGLQLEAGGTKCVDSREEQCFMHIKNAVCQRPLDGFFKRSDCCCTVGKAWGRDCVPCPRVGSEAMQQLCPRGQGSIGQKDVNECALIPNLCENGRCRNVVGSYTCRCNQGFALDEDGIKCIDLDECSIMPLVCGNGTCRNLPGSFTCDCEDGFEASMMMQTCMDRNECQLTPGLCKGGKCVNVPGSYRCECPPGLELTPDQQECKDIDECSRTSGICSNGVCENQLGSYTCVCLEGYRQIGNNRAHCEDINECELNNGGCESICLNTPGSYSCACSPGYMLLMDGKTCVDADECNDVRICNGGKCTNLPGSYACECVPGLMPSPDGSTCLDVDECRTDSGICGPGSCDNSVGSFQCRCDDGFSVRPELGPSCADEDECMMGNYICSHNAECINTEGSYDCRCLDGYTGDGTVCRDINECQVNNGGCHQDASCINLPGSFRCACDPGFEGDGLNCIDIDECSNNPNLCDNGQCLNHPGSFRCECDMGFMNPDDDDHSCTDINECDMFHQLCVFGRCENIHGMFRCVCNKGFQLDPTGGNCTDINECENAQSCLYGTCINTQGGYTCQCPPHHELTSTGNACVDRRKSQCYLDIGDDFGGSSRGRRPSQYGRECGRPIGDLISFSTCCCSVGTSWGPACEVRCPAVGSDDYNQLCPGANGFRPNGQTSVLEDIEECSDLSLICTHGKCVNTFGSFVCSCDPGYRLDVSKAMCVDRNECIEQPDACGVGQCINDDGGYHCLCPEGYMLLPSGHECVDMRKEPCYMEFNTSTLQCGHPMSSRQTRMLCCCSMGSAWGDACLPCPAPPSIDYTSLCGLRPGQIVNPMTGQAEEIDECSLMPHMCGKGVCVNLPSPTNFRCECYRGYVYDEVAHTCVDIDECNSGVSCKGVDCLRGGSGNPCQGNAQCINFPGSFECRCPEGYRLDNHQRGCSDINECVERIGICSNGKCSNFQGSWQCTCNPGFTLTPTRDSCVDVDECQRNPNMCANNGTCVNLLGTHKCLCPGGFKLSSNNDCEDMDECQMMLSACRHGRCRNTIGSFTCLCADGYTLTPDGQNCRDVNECDEIPNTCPKPGRCQNVMGNYLCTCPPGYELSSDGNYCRDLNECQINANLCSDGACINTDGGFICQCPQNYVLSTDGKKCVDVRQDLCYDSLLGGSYGRGVCSKPRRGYVTKMTCCCTGAKAWSSSCESCPTIGTREFEKLCPDGIGRGESGQDLDECAARLDLCQGGECINTDGSFRCECPQGYVLDPSGNKCVDENECASCIGPDRFNCTNVCGNNGTCFNVEGGFECACQDGFAPGPNQICEDIDECRERSHQCAFRCHNTLGSYRCACPFGFTLAPDGKHCTDLDECTTPVHNCKFQCKNLIGSFMCICPQGYEQIGSGDDCRDVNECAAPGGLCQNGRCLNLPGSYRCECYDGFEPSQDYTKCIGDKALASGSWWVENASLENRPHWLRQLKPIVVAPLELRGVHDVRGLLSASCSSPQLPQYLVDPQFFNPDVSPFPSDLHDSFDITSNNLHPDAESKGDECKNGWCGEDGNCICNPCWSGPTCQEYVDRFAPRFLAEEPFFIVDASSSPSISTSASSSSSSSSSATGGGFYSTFLDPAFDPIYPQFVYSSSSSSSADFVDPAPSPSLPPTNSWTTNTNPPYHSQLYSHQFHSHQNPLPLFRIESADDDLGLTCQLGQIGPAATCPCATPRYKVVAATTSFPERKSKELQFSPSNSGGGKAGMENKIGEFREGNDDGVGVGVTGENLNKNHHNLFWADEETGDVFLHQGFKLEPSKHYFITLQVSALPVNSSGYKPWKDEVIATLYVRPPHPSPEESLDNLLSPRVDVMVANSHYETTPSSTGSKTGEKLHPTTLEGIGMINSALSSADDEKSDEDLMPQNSRSFSSSEVYFDSSASSSKEGNESPHKEVPSMQTVEIENKEKSTSKQSFTKKRISSRNSKTKLPYALRGALRGPHYKFGDYEKEHPDELEGKPGISSNEQDNDPARFRMNFGGQSQTNVGRQDIDFDDDTGVEKHHKGDINVKGEGHHATPPAFFGDESTFLHRWKREAHLLTPTPEDFELSLLMVSKSSGSGNDGKMGVGDKIRMQLIIQLPSLPNNKVDFDVEIVSREQVPRFAILSAHVSSIGSDISFDKHHTNLAPILKPSKNISLYNSALWHWKGVLRREGGKNEKSRNKGITIDFDIVPVGDGGDGPSYSNASRRASLLQLSSLPISSSLSEVEVDSSEEKVVVGGDTLQQQGRHHGTNVKPLGKMTKDFNTYLLPIRARITFPLTRGDILHQHEHHQTDQSKPEKISERLFTLFVPKSETPASNSQLQHQHTSTPSLNGSASGHGDDKNLNGAMMRNPIINSRVHGVRVGVEGPREIPQGEWKSYTIKVYLQQSTQFKLTIEQMEGNEIVDQDSISVGDIRLVKVGKNIGSCNKLPEKGGFRVFCKKLSGGRRGDLCSVESPQLNLCPLALHQQKFASEGGSSPISISEENNDNSAKEDDSEENALIFEGIIYGIPSAAPGSQFVLRAKVQAQLFSSTTKGSFSSNVYQEVKTLSGKIVQMQKRLQSKGKEAEGSTEKNDFHPGKNSISIIPREVGFVGKEVKSPYSTWSGSRSRRSIFEGSSSSTPRSIWSKGRQQQKNPLFSTGTTSLLPVSSTSASHDNKKGHSASSDDKPHHRLLRNLRRSQGRGVKV